MTEPPLDAPLTSPIHQTYPPDLVAAVTAAQLSVCTQVVPAALEIRLAAAVQVPAGQWRRTAGARDPRVIELEAPHRRLRRPAGQLKPIPTARNKRRK